MQKEELHEYTNPKTMHEPTKSENPYAAGQRKLQVPRPNLQMVQETCRNTDTHSQRMHTLPKNHQVNIVQNLL